VKCVVKNVNRSPRGFYDAAGELHVLAPNAQVEVEITEEHAAEIIAANAKGGAFAVVREPRGKGKAAASAE
jgi:topoisomerase IA-like protein